MASNVILCFRKKMWYDKHTLIDFFSYHNIFMLIIRNFPWIWRYSKSAEIDCDVIDYYHFSLENCNPFNWFFFIIVTIDNRTRLFIVTLWENKRNCNKVHLLLKNTSEKPIKSWVKRSFYIYIYILIFTSFYPSSILLREQV